MNRLSPSRDPPGLITWLERRLVAQIQAGRVPRFSFKTCHVNRELYPNFQSVPGQMASPGLILLREAARLGIVRPGSHRNAWVDIRHLDRGTTGWIPERCRARDTLGQC